MDLILGGQLHNEELGDNGTNVYCVNVCRISNKKVKMHLTKKFTGD
jgi:hypothetical protein